MSRRRAQAGFTMPEVLVVILIISIAVAAISITQRGPQARIDSQSAADQVRAQLRLWRERSVSQGTSYTITASGSILTAVHTPAQGGAAITEQVGVAEADTINMSPNTLVFTSRGRVETNPGVNATAGSVTTFTIIRAGTTTDRIVTVINSTGAVCGGSTAATFQGSVATCPA